jgi:hypothetical protein
MDRLMNIGEYANTRKQNNPDLSWGEIGAEIGYTRDAVRMAAKRWRQRNKDVKESRPSLDQIHPAPQFEQATPPRPTMEQLIKLARDTQTAVNGVDPILINQTISLDADGPVGIIFVSCAHLGSRYVQHEAFEKLLNQVLEVPRLYWMDLGDQIEGMQGFFDVASAQEQALSDPKLQRELLAHVLDKLAGAGKLLAGFSGQHGARWARRKTGEDPVKKLYLERSIPYFDGQAYLKLDVGHEHYKLFAAHELPGHSIYNRNHPHKRAALFKAPNADVIIQGDKHTYGVQQVALDTWEYLAGERPSYMQWYVQAGTAKTGADPYTIQTWSPGVWEWPILIFRSDRHQIAQAADLDMARWMLSGW